MELQTNRSLKGDSLDKHPGGHNLKPTRVLAYMNSKLSHGLRALAGTLLLSLSVFATQTEHKLEARGFRIVPSESGPINYFRVVESPEGVFIRASYEPGYKTAVFGYQIPDDLRQGITSLSWRWRAQSLPVGANECIKGKSDSAAVVYMTFRRGLRWYALKYVWSSTLPKGTVCDKKRNPFRAQDTVVLESGGPLNAWKTVKINPQAEFRKHFEDGDASASVPDLIGIGLMSDGDQTSSKSSADFADFSVVHGS